MKPPWPRRLALAAACGAASLVVAYAVSGNDGLSGMALGLIATTLNMLALWGIILLFGRSMQDDRMPRGTPWIVLGLLVLKMPIFLLAGPVTQRFGNAGVGCFLVGLGLVYSFAVGWAIASS